MEETDNNQKVRAVIIGATGEVGKHVLKYMTESDQYSSILSIGRRQSDSDIFQNEKVEQLVIDMEQMDSISDRLTDRDVAFCCLGTTRKDAGSDEQFYKVDHDYVVNFATIAKNKGVEDFHLVSSVGAKSNSWFLYLKTKGDTERDCTNLNFKRMFIYRPGVLTERSNPRFLEKLAGYLYSSISVRKLGSLIGHLALRARRDDKGVNTVTIMENKELLNYYNTHLKDR